MSQQPIETQVVLTTDNSQYDRSMMESASVTASLAGAVDSLTQKIKDVSRSAGKGLIGIAAADVATIVGATAAYSSFEKQMTSLNAQAAVMNRTWTGGQIQMKAYETSVNSLRSSFGTTTADATQLVQVISRMSDSTAPIDKLANTFTKMGNATGESATALASSVLQLGRTMGTPQKDTEKYANSLTTLAVGANTSATAIADFANQIAPVGRLVGQSQADIQGISAAFIKSGQDGFRAATVYNKVLTDITYATQSGSPELAKYANFVGMTTDSFKNLSGTEKIVSFFERVNKLGPEAITNLNRMGLDGANTVKAITAVTQQTGGLSTSIQQSNTAMRESPIDRGNAAAMAGLFDDLRKLREELAMTAEAFGERFAPAAGLFVQSLEKMSGAARQTMQGPLGGLAAMAASIVAPLAALTGGALMTAGPLMAASALYGATRSSGAQGFRAGRNANGDDFRARMGTEGNWVQRATYGVGSFVGQGARRVAPPTPGANVFARGTGAALSGAGFGVRALTAIAFPTASSGSGFMPTGADPRSMTDPLLRQRFFQAGSFRETLGRGTDRLSAWAQTRGAAMQNRFVRADAGTLTSYAQAQSAAGIGRISIPGVTNQEARTAASLKSLGDEAKKVTSNFGAVGSGLRSLTGAMGGFALSAAGTGVAVGAQGVKFGGRLAGYLAGSAPAMGVGALMAGQALGVESNALTMGATGLMVAGRTGGAVGTVAGFGFDAYKQASSFNDIEKYQKEAKETSVLIDDFAANQAAIDELAKTNKDTDAGQYIPSIGGYLARGQLALSGILSGENPIKQREDAAWAATRKNALTGDAFGQIAREMGTPIEGGLSDPGTWEQIDQLVASIQPKLKTMGMTVQEVIDLRASTNASGDDTSWLEFLDKLIDPNSMTGLDQRIKSLGAFGRQFINSSMIQTAIAQPDNMNAQYAAVNQRYGRMSQRGLSAPQIMEQMGAIRAEVGETSAPEYQLAAGVQSMAQRQVGFELPFQSRTEQVGTQAELFAAARNTYEQSPGDPEAQAQMMAAEDSMMQSMTDQGMYFKNLLLQQREFNVSQDRALEDFALTRERMDYQYNLSRERASYDFHLQQKYQEEDFQLSRARANQDFELSQQRSTDAYYRNKRRAEEDFNLSRKRQERDYQHQVMLMVEQSAKSMYSIYDRVKVESSNSANFLLFNAQDQLVRMEEQKANLNKLRKSGVSDDVIQQLGLTDSANAQQLARFVSEVAGNPEMVREFNKAIRERLKAAAKLTKDESSSDWQEFERAFKLSRNRAQEDFQRAVERSHRDFKRQMNEMEEDFRRSMNRQAADYETAQDRQQDAFSLSMKRSAQDYDTAVDQMTEDFNKSMRRAQDDMNRMAREISGTLEEILTKSTNRLGRVASKQASSMLTTLRTFGIEFGDQGELIMSRMSKIFGFKWRSNNTPTGTDHPNSNNQNYTGGGGNYAGGVLPGPRGIGRDNLSFHSPEHGTLNLAGGEAIMVPEWVDSIGGPKAVAQMNAAARKKGSYFLGGVLPVNPSSSLETTQHSGYPWARWAGDLNIPGDETGNPVKAWKKGRVATTGFIGTAADPSYGNTIRINHPETEEQTLYAHLSRIMVNAAQSVSAGQQIGAVGNTGNSFGAHLHFELKGGTGPISVGNTSGGGGSSGTTRSLKSILKNRYPDVERAAADVDFFDGIPEGWPSKSLNSWARERWHKEGGRSLQSGPSHGPKNAPFTTDANDSNQDIVRAAMKSFGWNQWPSLSALVMQESGFNNTAQNPTSTAYGMFQFLDSTWAGVGGHKTSDPRLQSLYGMRYIKQRYGDPRSAWDFHQANNWYGDGGIFDGGAQTIGVGERGPEMVLPLNGTGANFMATLFRKMHVGPEGKQSNVRYSHTPVGHTTNTYQIDRSTNFSGPITVQANDPNEMLLKLQARQRTRALANPLLGGVR